MKTTTMPAMMPAPTNCPHCGETFALLSGDWRWNGDEWEHACPGRHPQAGHSPVGRVEGPPSPASPPPRGGTEPEPYLLCPDAPSGEDFWRDQGDGTCLGCGEPKSAHAPAPAAVPPPADGAAGDHAGTLEKLAADAELVSRHTGMGKAVCEQYGLEAAACRAGADAIKREKARAEGESAGAHGEHEDFSGLSPGSTEWLAWRLGYAAARKNRDLAALRSRVTQARGACGHPDAAQACRNVLAILADAPAAGREGAAMRSKPTVREIVSYHVRELPYTIRHWSYVAWLVLRHRPLVRCPACKGQGGEMSGYYEPEWSECRCCYYGWNRLEDHGWPWFVGRVSPWMRLRVKVATRYGFEEGVRIRDVIRCRLGIHRWAKGEWVEPGEKICCVCYENKDHGEADEARPH